MGTCSLVCAWRVESSKRTQRCGRAFLATPRTGIEQGDPGLAIGQVLRYLDAIAPGSTLVDLLTEADPALVSLAVREQTQRVRDLSSSELDELNF